LSFWIKKSRGPESTAFNRLWKRSNPGPIDLSSAAPDSGVGKNDDDGGKVSGSGSWLKYGKKLSFCQGERTTCLNIRFSVTRKKIQVPVTCWPESVASIHYC